MQDIHSIGGGGGEGRLFGGVGGSNDGDRRLRPHNHNHHHTPPAMKCPRCESLNTKFCYYNNYNLSQPRYFCKSCRRYWTKGGVLRNVPVGGGCRKTKRSKSSKSNPSGVRKSSISRNSSSDSCKITEKTTPTTTNPAINSHETISTTTGFVDIPDSVRFDPQFSSENNNGMFPEIGTLTSLITSQTPLGFNDISPPFRNEWLETDQQTIGESPSEGFTHDWNNAAADQALFDLAGTVDQSFWKWNDHDQLNREL